MKCLPHTLFLFLVSIGAWGQEPYQYPTLRAPKLARAPIIDGRLEAAEWAGAAAITGFAAGGPGSTNSLVPQVQQVIWYVAFDDRFLYLAMHSPHPKGTYPQARCKAMDDGRVLFEDHVEIQLLPHDRALATMPGKGFYKMMVNPRGAMIDQWLYNNTPGTEELWSTGGEVKCSVTPTEWDLEMSIEARRMNLSALEGRDLVVQLVRTDFCGGIYFAGWVGATWLEWQRFGQITFDSRAPVFQLTQLGEVMAGDLDARVALTGTEARPTEVNVAVTVQDATGKNLFAKEQAVTVQRGETKALAFVQRGLAVTEVDIADKRRNTLEVSATYKDGGKTVTLYRCQSPFMKLDDAFRTKYLEPWIKGRPQSGEWECRLAYLPYSNKADAAVDLDFFGVPGEVSQAKQFAVQISCAQDARAVAKAQAGVTNMAGRLLFDVPELPEGQYEATFTLLDDGGKVVGIKTQPFTRKRFPWEHNRLGISEEVIPPFKPITVKDRELAVWGRTYTVGELGLPSQIVAGPPTGTVGRPENLLAAPIRLELQIGGKPVVATAATSALGPVAGHRADIQASAQLGDIALRTSAFMEYDGWYQVELALTPGRPVRADSLDLVADLRDCAGDRWNPLFPVDTLFAQRLGMGADSFYGDIPRKPGVQFKSTSLQQTFFRGGPTDVAKDWKSFVPATYVGNGDRGLWLFAWSDAGWEMKDTEPVVQVERLADGNVRLRLRMIAGPVDITAPRKLRFALQAAPIKPNDSKYRTREPEIAHDTSGYRYYGDSVDGFALHSDADFEALRKFLIYGQRYQEGPNRYTHWEGGVAPRVWEAYRVMMYGSQWLMGSAPEEFDSFAGEWLGDSLWTPKPDLSFSGKWNYGRTVQWNTPRQLEVVRANFCPSMIDFYVWYHQPLIARCGFNGTWWDNCYMGLVTDYDPELGRLDSKWNLIYRRELCKRLNVLGWQHMRPPCWSMNTQVDMPWCQVFWMVEGGWYPDSQDQTALNHFKSLGRFRADARPRTSCMIAKPWLRGFKGTTPEKDLKIRRSVDGMLLCHDIPPMFSADLTRKLQYAVDWGNSRNCLFSGYWSTGLFVTPPSPAVVASAYQNKQMRSAVVLFYNTDPKDQYLGGTTLELSGVMTNTTGVPAQCETLGLKRAYDLETGAPVQLAFRQGRLEIAEGFVVKGHEYRTLALEGE